MYEVGSVKNLRRNVQFVQTENIMLLNTAAVVTCYLLSD